VARLDPGHLVPRRYVYLASLTDIAAKAGHLGEHHDQMPPAGYDELQLGASKLPQGAPVWPLNEVRLPCFISFTEPTGDPNGWWWGTVADVILATGSIEGGSLMAFLQRLVERFGGSLAALLDAPVVLKGKGENTMRWLQSTFRGTLFGEQFQHKIDWGNAGSDPNITAAEALEFAETLADAWSTTVGASIAAACASDVKYTEVGVVQLNQDDPAGDVTESFQTEWFMYSTGTEPVGATSVSLPYEVSCCVTLQTDQRGARGRGRFYLPPFNINAITTHGLWNMATVGPVVSAIGDGFFDSVIGTASFRPIVVSRKFRVLNNVTSMNVGSVPDAQRRRRRSLVETRVNEWTLA
jgi:hypothetical protein